MAIHIGGEKFLVATRRGLYRAIVAESYPTPDLVGDELFSSDGYVLLDKNGVYLIPKSENPNTANSATTT